MTQVYCFSISTHKRTRSYARDLNARILFWNDSGSSLTKELHNYTLLPPLVISTSCLTVPDDIQRARYPEKGLQLSLQLRQYYFYRQAYQTTQCDYFIGPNPLHSPLLTLQSASMCV